MFTHSFVAILLFLLCSCSPRSNLGDSTPSAANVSQGSITGNTLILAGSNLQDITAIRVSDSNSLLQVTSNAPQQMTAKFLSPMEFLVNQVYNLVLSTAQADTTVPITFSIPNASITPDLLSDTYLSLADGGTVSSAVQVNNNLTLGNTGKLGIGLTTPATELEIRALSTTDPAVRLGPILKLVGMGNDVAYPAAKAKVALDLSTYDTTSNPPSARIVATDIGSFRNTLEIQTKNGTAPSIATRLLIDGTGQVGIGTTTPTEMLHVMGTILADDGAGGESCLIGGVSGTACTSDLRLKDKITTLTQVIQKIQRIRGVNFVWKNKKNSGSGELPQIGLIAQEVEEVFPELVSTDQSTGMKRLNYSNLVAPLIEAIKEQEKKIQQLKRGLCEINPKASACTDTE